MSFSNVFDNSFPLDTQQARLLGDDIRKTKLDLQERLASCSGLAVNKPNFADDSQPDKWNGFLFFAVDIGRIFQFNNPNWTDVTNLIQVGTQTKKYFALAANTTANDQSFGSLLIPSGLLNIGSLIKIYAVVFVPTLKLVVGNASPVILLSGSSLPTVELTLFVTSLTEIVSSNSKDTSQPDFHILPDLSVNGVSLDFRQTGDGVGFSRYVAAVVFP